MTGHRRAREPDVDWRSLAGVGGTIVVLMGVSALFLLAALGVSLPFWLLVRRELLGGRA